MAADGHLRQPVSKITASRDDSETGSDLIVVADWKTLLGRLINDAGRLRLFPHRITMFLLLAHHSELPERKARLAAASATLGEWQRIVRGMTTDHADIGVSPSLSPMLTAFMASRRVGFDACVERFGGTATALISVMAEGGQEYDRLSGLADYVASDLLECMNQLVGDFAAELSALAEGERDVGLTTRRTVAALETSADTVARLADDLARINANVRIIALNATIEAARSGENGRVFGAVAVEIKALSGRITRLTSAIQQHLQRA